MNQKTIRNYTQLMKTFVERKISSTKNPRGSRGCPNRCFNPWQSMVIHWHKLGAVMKKNMTTAPVVNYDVRNHSVWQHDKKLQIINQITLFHTITNLDRWIETTVFIQQQGQQPNTLVCFS